MLNLPEVNVATWGRLVWYIKVDGGHRGTLARVAAVTFRHR